MASSPPAKRPRTDDSAEAGMVKDTELWFEDGNIVVVAQGAAFRVHRGVLSRHSHTFSGLFTLPQPLDGESVDGCPVVRVPDSAYDFKYLLHALYDGLRFLEPGKPVSFSTLAALARLGHKYELAQVLQASINRLKTVFTTDLATWMSTRNQGKSPASITVASTHAIEAVNLFHALDRPEMLPVALYQCTTLANATLLRGSSRADGTPEQLSPEDLERCLNARDQFTKRGTHLLYNTFALEPSPGCTSWEKCERTYDAHRANLDTRARAAEGVIGRNVLHGLGVPFIENTRKKSLLCAPCIDLLVARLDQFHKEIWLGLPKTLGLDSVDGWPTA